MGLQALPDHAQQQARAGGVEDGLERLLADVALEALLPLGGAFAAFGVVLRRLIAQVLVLLRRRFLHLTTEVADVLSDLGRRVAQVRRSVGCVRAAFIST